MMAMIQANTVHDMWIEFTVCLEEFTNKILRKTQLNFFLLLFIQ